MCKEWFFSELMGYLGMMCWWLLIFGVVGCDFYDFNMCFWGIGELYVCDFVDVFFDGGCEVVFYDLYVVDVVLECEIGYVGVVYDV